MAAKKTAKKTTETTSPKAAPAAAPAAQKAAKKAAAGKAPPAKKATKTVKASAPQVSTDAIARAAYLNYRRRVEQGLPGDSRGDWLEAERQLTGDR